jgi:hypothetical protein
MLGITEDEELAMHEIITPAKARLWEIQNEWQSLMLRSNPAPPDEEVARTNAYLQEKETILKEVVARLEQVFNAEDFRRLDAYVYEMSGEGMLAEGRMRVVNGLPRHPQSATSSAPGQQQNPSGTDPVLAVPQR